MSEATQTMEHSDTIALAQRLRMETAQAHDRAESSRFVVDLMEGLLGVPAFIALQEQALLFYRAMEQALDSFQDNPCVQYVADRRLDRAQRLEHDVQMLGGNVQPTPLPATAAYIQELERIADQQDAPAMIAHHYVRYLGDLSGGQVIASKMERLLQISPEALTFYEFDSLGKLKPYKDHYRESLDKLEAILGDDELDALVNAAGEAFLHNQQVFVDLGKLYSA